MLINFEKTVRMSFTRKQITHEFDYYLNGNHISTVREFKYLGVFLTETLSWDCHVRYVTAKACKVLGFLRRNAKHFPIETKQLLYVMNVRPILEYACTVWDPWLKKDIKLLEKVQNLAVRFVLNNDMWQFNIPLAKESLGWETLEIRRKKLRLKMFHNIFHTRTCIDKDKYIFPPLYISSRIDHTNKVREYKCRTQSFRNTFFPRTISEWNRLTNDVATMNSNAAFYSML